MEYLEITGGVPLIGSINVSGAKNSVLPILAASLLTEEPLELDNVPHLYDVTTMMELLGCLGANITVYDGMHIAVQSKNIYNVNLPSDLVRSMRASILTLGPLLARVGKAKMPMPGGCAIGQRLVNFHLDGLTKMGAQVKIEDGMIIAEAKASLKACHYHFDQISVTGTENLLMAATLAKGTTFLTNVAMEPEVTDLIRCLNMMGAKISGAGTKELIIEGVEELSGTHYRVLPDRIEAGTYMVAAAITKGRIRLNNVCASTVEEVIKTLIAMGITVRQGEDWIEVDAIDSDHQGVDIVTAPYPGFPTDLQAPFMALNALATSPSRIDETIFENRFNQAKGLNAFGAHIRIDGNTAIINPTRAFKAAEVVATDLRASASLVLGALAAKGTSRIYDIHHIDRGYECLEEKLSHLGANLHRVLDVQREQA